LNHAADGCGLTLAAIKRMRANAQPDTNSKCLFDAVATQLYDIGRAVLFDACL
jgi:hypothetical protein